jgi:uncharacterized membrane protein YvlD (DUF360 family)
VIRFVVRTLVFFASAAIGLLVAKYTLDGMTITAGSFLMVVVIFAVLQSVLAPFFARTTNRNAPALLGGVGLITTFVSLLITAAVTDGLEIDGASTWLFASLIVWIVTMLATLLLPTLLAMAGVKAVRENRAS